VGESLTIDFHGRRGWTGDRGPRPPRHGSSKEYRNAARADNGDGGLSPRPP